VLYRYIPGRKLFLLCISKKEIYLNNFIF